MSATRMEREEMRKPYLSGWRHRISGLEYYNADSQTGPPPKRIALEDTCSRGMRFVETKERATQSLRERATQMWRNDCHVPSVTDKVLATNIYESHDETMARLDFHARIIQRAYRVYKLRKYMKECAAMYRKMIDDCRKHEEEKVSRVRRRREEEDFRRSNPRTRRDLNLLYESSKNRSLEETSRLKSRYFECHQRAIESCVILERTAKSLRDIDEHRRFMKNVLVKKKRLSLLENNCKATRWSGYKGLLIEMITLRTQLARSYKNMFDKLDEENVEERVHVLVSLKDYLVTHEWRFAEELIDLLDQEIELLGRGTEWSEMEHLRKRIAGAFLTAVDERNARGCESENKELEKLLGPLEEKTALCKGCKKLLPGRRFAMHARARKLSLCKNCLWLQQRNIGHINFEPFVLMLDGIRGEERKRNSFSKASYIMQLPDIYYLVNNIWHGHSIISENNDVYLLRLARFDASEDWTPWNCILLTEDETEVHYRVKNLRDLYSKYVHSKIKLAHETAKLVFKGLKALDNSLHNEKD